MVSTGASIPFRIRSISAYCSLHRGGSGCAFPRGARYAAFSFFGVERPEAARLRAGDAGSSLIEVSGSSSSSLIAGSRLTRFRAGSAKANLERSSLDELEFEYSGSAVRVVERGARRKEVNSASLSRLISGLVSAVMSATRLSAEERVDLSPGAMTRRVGRRREWRGERSVSR